MVPRRSWLAPQSQLRRALSGAVALILAGAPTAATFPGSSTPAAEHSTPFRRPQGIYAVVALDRAGAGDVKALLNNSAVSGLAIRTFWSTLQPAAGTPDFSQLDAVFASAAAVSKTVQLMLVPGFGTPPWVLNQLSSCDSMLSPLAAGSGKKAGGSHGKKNAGGDAGKPGGRHTEKVVPGRPGAPSTAPATCGKATFQVSEGADRGEDKELPLPWNAVYKRHWKEFLKAVAARYGSNDAFVSIAVAGPTAESVEIILPSSGNQQERWGQLLQVFYRDAAHQQTDQAFVDEWAAAATVYGEVFSNITLVLTRGSGLPNVTPHQGKPAQTSIVSAFAGAALGTNHKATQTSGMKACRETKFGIKGVKETASDPAYSPPILGGAQFNSSFSEKPATEGCSSGCDAGSSACQKVTAAEALYNVLTVYFDGTPDGDKYGAGASKGSARMNYLQIYQKDIVFANNHPAIQDTLVKASKLLLKQAR